MFVREGAGEGAEGAFYDSHLILGIHPVAMEIWCLLILHMILLSCAYNGLENSILFIIFILDQ